MSNKRVKGEQLYMFMEVGGKWTPVGCSTDCSLSMSADATEISRKGQGAWRCFRPGQKQWSLDCAGFYFDGELPTNFIAGAESVGQQIRVAMSVLEPSLVDMGVNLSTVAPNTSHTIVGDAIITNCEYSGSKGGLATYRVSMQGSGEIKPIM